MKKDDRQYIINKITDIERKKYLDGKFDQISDYFGSLDITLEDLIIILDKISMFYKVQWMEKKEFMINISLMYDYYKDNMREIDEKL